MGLYDPILTTTLPVRHPKEGLYYLPLRKELRDQLHLMDGCSIELAILKVYPPPIIAAEAKKK